MPSHLCTRRCDGCFRVSPSTWATGSYVHCGTTRNLPEITVFGLFFRKAPILQIRICAGNFLRSVLSVCTETRFAIGSSFRATALALRRKPSMRVICFCATIRVWGESLNPDDRSTFKSEGCSSSHSPESVGQCQSPTNDVEIRPANTPAQSQALLIGTGYGIANR